MNEVELARKLVQRGVLGEPQLREAESYARGGRSLFSILLDLGHVRPEDLAALVPPPPPARRGIFPIIAVGIALLAAFFLGLALVPRSTPMVRSREFVAYPPAFARELVERALPILRRAEEAAGADGTAKTPELARAAALLEQAAMEGQEGVDVLYPLARSLELLERDETARQIYLRIAKMEPMHGRTLAGLSRTALHAGQAAVAHKYADLAVQYSPGAESLFARGKAQILLGRVEEARSDLVEAARRDRTYGDAVSALLRRLETAR